MPPTNPRFPNGSRVANLAVSLAISATASVAAPVAPQSLTALNITLGCLAVTLLATVIALLVRGRTKVDQIPAAVVVPGAGEIVKSARDAIFVIQESGEIASSNPAAEKLFGYPFSELRGKSIAALIPPPAKGRRRENYIHSAEGRELIGVRKSGNRFPLDLVLSELPGPGGKRFSVVVRDRSDRNRAEEEIQTQQRFASALIRKESRRTAAKAIEVRIATPDPAATAQGGAIRVRNCIPIPASPAKAIT